jgi:ubiquinone/menaquinone biosynthesis C-methylase UbiE
MSMKCTYEFATGGSTRAVTEQVLSHYLESESLEGKVVLDNACGPGVVTKEILKQAGDVKIDAVDISTPMIEELRSRLSSLDNSSKVTATVMDAQVPSTVIFD